MKKEKVRVYKYKKDRIFDFILFILLIMGSFIVLFPILWMIMTALKTTQEVAKFPAVLFPEEFHWENFAIAWSKAPFTRYTLNSLFLVVINIVGAVLSNSIIAYAFAKMKFPGRELFFNIILATMMIRFVDSTICYLFQTALDRKLSAVDGTGLSWKCISYFHDAAVLQNHSYRIVRSSEN